MNKSDEFLDALSDWAGLVTKRSMHEFVRYAKGNGYSMSQLGALMHLNKIGVSGIADIGDHLGVTTAAVSQMIDRMVGQGFLERTEDPEDRRAKRIELTDRGKQVIDGCAEARQRWFKPLASILSEDERRNVTEALRLIITKTQELEKDSL